MSEKRKPGVKPGTTKTPEHRAKIAEATRRQHATQRALLGMAARVLMSAPADALREAGVQVIEKPSGRVIADGSVMVHVWPDGRVTTQLVGGDE